MNNFVLLDITLILGCLVLFKELMQLLRNHIAKIHLKLLSAMEFLLLHHILTISAVNASICFEHLQIIPYPLLFDISFLYSVFKVHIFLAFFIHNAGLINASHSFRHVLRTIYVHKSQNLQASLTFCLF